MYINACIDVYTHTCVDIIIHTCIDIYIHTCIDIFIHTCIDIYTLTYIDIYTHSCIENISKPTIENERLHQDRNNNGVRIVNFAKTKMWLLRARSFHTETFISTPGSLLMGRRINRSSTY